MSNYKTCKKCGAPLGGDDIAIYRKLVTRNADEFFCIDCLAEYYFFFPVEPAVLNFLPLSAVS